MDLLPLLLDSNRGGDWKRLLGIVATLAFLFLSSLRRSRSKPAQRGRQGTGRRRPYEPIEARGFPAWVWWGFLVLTAIAYFALLPYVTTVAGRALMAGVALVLLVLLRVLGGRAERNQASSSRAASNKDKEMR